MKREIVCVCFCMCVRERKKDSKSHSVFNSVYANVRVFSTGCTLGLTCVEAVLVSGAVAVNGEGGAREGVGCCCCDNSEPAPPTATAPVPDNDPSAPEKTPVDKRVKIH